MKRVISGAVMILTAVSAFSRDIDVANYVQKYWYIWHNRNVETADGDKRWPLTPESKAERLRHFKAMMQKFAPHIVEESFIIDRALGWKEGTYLEVMRFGARNVAPKKDVPSPEHECTTWVTMDNLTGGKSILIHKNRDSRGRPLTLQRRAVPGKHAWIGNGPQYGFQPTQGINDRGVAVMMNAGDALPEAENSQYGFGVLIICRILLEECATAEEAVKLLEKIIYSDAHTHVECGSIWFIGDHKNVYIVEHSNRKFVAKAVNSGFIARANAFHYPEMQIYSLRSHKSLIQHSHREYAIRDFLVNKQWRQNGVITPLDNAAASRIDKLPDGAKGAPPCGKSTISATTFAIDKEYPEYLSTAYMVFSWPKSSVYLPVSVTLSKVPEELCNGSLSNASFELMDKKQPLLPDDELNTLEKKIYERHAAAVDECRKILRTSTVHTTQNDVSAILEKAFKENFEDIKSVYNKQVKK